MPKDPPNKKHHRRLRQYLRQKILSRFKALWRMDSLLNSFLQKRDLDLERFKKII